MPFTRQWNLNSIKKKANIFLKTFEFDFFDSKSSLILTAIKNIWITFFTANTFSFIHVVDSLFFKCYISFLFLIHCWNVFSFSFLPFTFFFLNFEILSVNCTKKWVSLQFLQTRNKKHSKDIVIKKPKF